VVGRYTYYRGMLKVRCNYHFRSLEDSGKLGILRFYISFISTVRVMQRSSNAWSVSCRYWCLIVCIIWHPAVCLPCASGIADNAGLVVVAYARQHVVILLFQPQGRSDTVLAALPWQDRPPGTLFQCRYANAILYPHSFVTDLKTELFVRAYH